MKKAKYIAVLVAAVLCLAVFAACAPIKSGRYVSEAGDLVYEISGNKISGPATFGNQGTYRIENDNLIIKYTDKDGKETEETLIFGKFDGFILIDGVKYVKEAKK